MEILGTNFGYQVTLRLYLPGIADEVVLRQVAMDFPGRDTGQYVVSFIRQRGGAYEGQWYIQQSELRRADLSWVRQNVPIRVEDFPIRLTCAGSMRPTLRCGDALVIEPAPFDEPLQVGAVIGYRVDPDAAAERECSDWFNAPNLRGGPYLIHRINRQVHGSSPQSFITKGDNNAELDPCPANARDIIFRVVGKFPNQYVLDRERYDRYQEEHQRLLTAFRETREEYGELSIDLRLGIREYARLLRDADTGQEILDQHLQSLETTRLRLEQLFEESNRLWRELLAVQAKLEETVR